MAQSWQIDRLRVLAAAAEPAEPRPGDTVTFSSLTVSPAEPWGGTVWLACEGITPCTLDPSALSDSGATSDAALIGFEPDLPPSLIVPLDFLDALEPDARQEGAITMLSIIAFLEGFDLQSAEADFEDLAADAEITYKRLPVSEAITPNHNPTIVGLEVEGVPVAEGTLVELDRGQPYTITPVLSEDSLEAYTYRNTDGVEEARVEQPWFTWYLQEGAFDQAYTLYPEVDVDYYAPTSPKAESGSLWVVVRDRRGGMAWRELGIRWR